MKLGIITSFLMLGSVIIISAQDVPATITDSVKVGKPLFTPEEEEAQKAAVKAAKTKADASKNSKKKKLIKERKRKRLNK